MLDTISKVIETCSNFFVGLANDNNVARHPPFSYNQIKVSTAKDIYGHTPFGYAR